MTHILIQNIGPIIKAELDLKKINVIMGPQSSGKSTINKIICYCSWVEKKASRDMSFDFFEEDAVFINELVRFHKIEGYVKPTTFISYESDVLKFTYSGQSGFNAEWKDIYAFRNSKIAYIPAERNIVAVIPNWFEVKFLDNNILSYMKDWGEARMIHTKENPYKILELGTEYYYEDGRDFVKTKDNEILNFTNTSSGLQSVIPLSVLVYYFTKWIYENEVPSNIEQKRKNNIMFGSLLEDIVLIPLKSRALDDIVPGELQKIFTEADEHPESDVAQKREYMYEIFKFFTKYQYSNLFIEEPEQNLFPSTQRDLLYSLLENVTKSDRENTLLITTHSPYILYALNNCMLGGVVQDKLSEEELNELKCNKSFIHPDHVSVYEIKDNILVSIQKEDGLIGNNFLDEKMKEVMDDFYTLLDHFE